ncbi:hypothetical protein FHX74_000518 [Friedmanniella endophytica]|uniref:Helicase C-terminal domain-containing protein n=1 Tax=Microlunatus kandeliicorticis TaxID=1759536 RepID=A0A7W3IPN3_9ACTN|nr:DEAD/DEAH box helicase [Microlunatus kandeliicorticis]MBA8792924.1 hypothetical protein [Microlunatus kandeliicorticis]
MSVELTARLRIDSPVPAFQEDWTRQRRTASDILNRFRRQEGVILADQVGMGKTYVALAVAVSQILATKPLGQVLVLAPAAVADKWVREWSALSASLLLPGGPEVRCSPGALRSGEALLAALDDPPDRRAHLVVATHTALTSRLKDTFVQLAVLQAAVRGRPGADDARSRIARWCDRQRGLIQDRRLTPDRVRRLLQRPPQGWRSDWAEIAGEELPDDPVPEAVIQALGGLDLAAVRSCVDALPKYSSKNIDLRLKAARAQISAATQSTWKIALASTRLQMPLLIVDEAHRLKNDQTLISQLFAPRKAAASAGALTGHFDRMLMLTATPFELGHHELIRVLSRLSAVRGPLPAQPPLHDRLATLAEVLRLAQGAAVHLDGRWSALQPHEANDFDTWTPDAPVPAEVSAAATSAWRAAQEAVRTRQQMHDVLAPWVIRHQRALRRSYIDGAAVSPGASQQTGGIQIEDDIALPFLLAARAQSLATEESQGGSRPYFAYGIASSFEAFGRLGGVGAELDNDDPEERRAPPESPTRDASGAGWYRHQINLLLQEGDLDLGRHPKIAATVDRALDLWSRGDKCLIFCWFIRTGQAVERVLSERVDAMITRRAATALSVDMTATDDELERLAERLLRRGSGSHDFIRRRLHELFSVDLGVDQESVVTLTEAAIRQLRTPGSLVRFTPLHPSMTAEELWRGASGDNPGKIDLRIRWRRFAARVAQMSADERVRIFDALLGEQTEAGSNESDEVQGRGTSLRPVRRAHGGTERSLRERLIAVFNTPFAPDLLVASSVMGEGIDLHRECRHVIHHDLDWNPSVLEQRTGRLDRIGALAEAERADIAVWEPYLGGTHDEKMFRVVKDRAGWFDVVMGRPTAQDESSTDAEERRVPLAPSIRSALRMNLESR